MVEPAAQNIARGVMQQGAAQMSQATNSVLRKLEDRLHPATLGMDSAQLQAGGAVLSCEAVAKSCAGRTAEDLLGRAGLSYNEATTAWLASHHGPDLLRILDGFKLDGPAFLKLV